MRDAAGFKLIHGGNGGGQGKWSPQQLPNMSAAPLLLEASGGGREHDPTTPAWWAYAPVEAARHAGEADGATAALYHLPSDDGERSAPRRALAPARAPAHAPDLPRHAPHRERPSPRRRCPAPLDLDEHDAVVARLQALRAAYEEDKVPQLTGDPACPKFAPLDSPEGKWIGPWCDGF